MGYSDKHVELATSVCCRMTMFPRSSRPHPGPRHRFAAALGLVVLGLIPAVSVAAQNAAPVAVAPSQSAPIIREERVTGTVTSPRSASLSAQVGGMVARIAVEEGDRVEPGQVLLELDRELAEHALETAEADRARARATLADARRRLDEGQRLVADKSIPRSEYESLGAAVEIAEAELAAATAEARQQAAVLERHQIKAPFAGVVSERRTELGEWVAPGTAVLELVATEGLRFDFRVPQELYPRLDGDAEVVLSLNALPEAQFPGRIAAAVPVSDPAARTFLLRVLPADEAHPAITPGMSARALLRIDTGREGVVVPRDALLRYPDGRVSVWVLEEVEGATRVSERLVELGLIFGDRVEIREGLEAGATVVVEGNEALQDGQAVRVHSRR